MALVDTEEDEGDGPRWGLCPEIPIIFTETTSGSNHDMHFKTVLAVIRWTASERCMNNYQQKDICTFGSYGKVMDLSFFSTRSWA